MTHPQSLPKGGKLYWFLLSVDYGGVKTFLNFGRVRLAWNSGNGLLAANLRVLRRFLQIADNEIFRMGKSVLGLSFQIFLTLIDRLLDCN